MDFICGEKSSIGGGIHTGVDMGLVLENAYLLKSQLCKVEKEQLHIPGKQCDQSLYMGK